MKETNICIQYRTEPQGHHPSQGGPRGKGKKGGVIHDVREGWLRRARRETMRERGPPCGALLFPNGRLRPNNGPRGGPSWANWGFKIKFFGLVGPFGFQDRILGSHVVRTRPGTVKDRPIWGYVQVFSRFLLPCRLKQQVVGEGPLPPGGP